MFHRSRLLPLILLAALSACDASAQTVRDSVRMDVSVFTFYNQNDGNRNCGAGLQATWPNVLQDLLGSPDRTYGVSDYGRVATEGQRIYYLGPLPDLPEGTLGFNTGLGSAGGGPTGGDDSKCAGYEAYWQPIAAGQWTRLNGGPWRVTEWYATFSVPSGTPIALFEWEPADGLAVAFDASFEHDPVLSREVDATAPGGKRPVASYAWDFGDGDSGTGATPTHAYDEPGEYLVRLTVTDDDGETNSREESVTVHAAHLTVEVLSATEEVAEGDTVRVEARVTNTGTVPVFSVRATRALRYESRISEALDVEGSRTQAPDLEAVALADGEAPVVESARLDPGESVEVVRSYRVVKAATYYPPQPARPEDVHVDWTGLVRVEGETPEQPQVKVRQPCVEAEAPCATTLIAVPKPAELTARVRVELEGDEATDGDTLVFVGVVKNTGDEPAHDLVASADFDVATVFPDSVSGRPTTDPVLLPLPETMAPVTRDELAPGDTLEVRRRYVVDRVATYQDEEGAEREVAVRILVTPGEVAAQTEGGGPVEVDRSCDAPAAGRLFGDAPLAALVADGDPDTPGDLPDCSDGEADIVPLSTDLVVNSTEDTDDEDPADGVCDTGERLTVGGEEVRECTLRAAIEEANTQGGGEITFDIEGEGVPRIELAERGLPAIETPIVLNGDSQPRGWVELVGPGAEAAGEDYDYAGLYVTDGGGGTEIRGFVIHGFRYAGIAIMAPYVPGTGPDNPPSYGDGADGCLIEGNRIGTDVTGTLARGNGKSAYATPGADSFGTGGLRVTASGTVVRDNVIAGNHFVDADGYPGGMEILIDGGSDTQIYGNRIGVGATGEVVALPGRTAVESPGYHVGLFIRGVFGGSGTQVGGGSAVGQTACATELCNHFAGHRTEIRLGESSGDESRDNVIRGNVIGSPVEGPHALDGTSTETKVAVLDNMTRTRIELNSIYTHDHAIVAQGAETEITGNHIHGAHRKRLRESHASGLVEADQHAAVVDYDHIATVKENSIWTDYHAVLGGKRIGGNTLRARRADIVFSQSGYLTPGAVITQNDHSMGGVSYGVYSTIYHRGSTYEEPGGPLTFANVRAERANDWGDTDGHPNAPVILAAIREGGTVTLRGRLRTSVVPQTYAIEAFAPTGTYEGTTELPAGASYFEFGVGVPESDAYLGSTLGVTATGLLGTSVMVQTPPVVPPFDAGDATLDVSVRDLAVERVGATVTVQEPPPSPGRQATGQGWSAAGADAARVFFSRTRAPLDTLAFVDTTATAASGAAVRPADLAAQRWTVDDVGLTEQTRGPGGGATVGVCLDPSGLVNPAALGDVVVVRRGITSTGDAWLPLDTRVGGDAAAPLLCADGLTVLGEFGIGGAGAAFPVADEDEPVGSAPPSALALSVFPNPVRSTATVPVALPAAAHVRLAVVDVLGREVALVLDADRPAGRHDVALDTARLPAGVYVLRLEAGDEVRTRRFTVVH